MKVMMTVKKGCAAQSNNIQPTTPERGAEARPADAVTFSSRSDNAIHPV